MRINAEKVFKDSRVICASTFRTPGKLARVSLADLRFYIYLERTHGNARWLNSHLKRSQLWVIINKSIINALSCCHITYSMFWQNIPINRFHSNKHKDTFEFASLPFCSKCQHIFRVICTCFVGFNSEQGREEQDREERGLSACCLVGRRQRRD